MKIVYPGSFDPVTIGHMDIIQRSAAIFDEVVVGVLTNTQKASLFSSTERIEMIEQLLYDYDNVSVQGFSGLLVDFVRLCGADGVVRGLREMTDFEYERQMALLNRSMFPQMETIFLVADSAYSYISSSYAREIAMWGGDVSRLVPPLVEEKLREKYSTGGKNGHSAIG
uniref:pantetheine-phosphate adenylyltransferase n=1 Tax=Ndongobacter massiliensis TaxID=1871025 RepID=UPI000930D3C0|nr:pantetheine-phosphate adenylyltransferase [Ndongobacter massiliensis]